MIDRRRVGALGEAIGVRFLERRGAAVVARNVRVGRGELDAIAVIGGRRTAIEIRTITGRGDPVAAVDDAKLDRVHALARKVRPPCSRVEVVAIRLHGRGADVHRLVRA